jgi:hypothetical protein
MCTLTWGPLQDGYFIAFSRDELRSRAAGLGPRAIERNGVRALLPIDGEAGGTWIAVNELGCAVALLNGYRFQVPGAPAIPVANDWISRGRLGMEVSDASTVAEVAERIASQDLSRYRPFELVAFDGEGRVGISSWNGTALERRALSLADRPLVSSSFDDDGVRKQRRALFARLMRDGSSERDVLRFHSRHEPSRGPYSPCMHREDAHTVSFTHVRVSAAGIELSYQAQSPCAAGPTLRVELERRSVARS